MSPQLKRTLGLTLVVLCGAGVLRWTYISLKTGDPFEPSALLLIGTPFCLFIGLSLLASSMPAMADEGKAKKLRKMMILIYFAACAGLAFLFLVAHLVTAHIPLPAGKSYAPLIIFAGLVTYAYCYWKFVRNARYHDRSPLIIPFLFIMGLLLSPLMVINIYNNYSQSVDVLDSVADLEKAESDFVQFKHLDLDYQHAMDWTHTWSGEKNRYHVELWGLVPVITNPGDTSYTTWIDLQFFTWYKNDRPREQLDSLEFAYYATSRSILQDYNYQKATFFDRSLREGVKVLENNHYPISESTVLLKPHYESFQEYRSSGTTNLLWGFGIITLMFWVVSTGWLDREGYW